MILTLTPTNHAAIERACESAPIITKREPGFPAVHGYPYRRGKALLFVTHNNPRNAAPLTSGAVGTTFFLPA